MNIFQKNINSTMILIALFSSITGFMLARILTHYFYIERVSFAETVAERIFEPQSLACLCITLFNTSGVFWIMKQKNIRTILTIVLIILFIPLPAVLLLINICYPSVFQYDSQLFNMCMALFLGWIIGWLILIVIKKREPENQIEEVGKIRRCLKNLLNIRLLRFFHKTKVAAIVSIIFISTIWLFGILSFVTYSGIDFGYSLYRTQVDFPDQLYSIQFDYPICFKRKIYNTDVSENDKTDEIEFRLSRVKNKQSDRLNGEMTLIDISVFDKTSASFTSNTTLLEMMLKDAGESTENNVKIENNENIIVSGISADYLVASYKSMFSYFFNCEREYTRFVFFESDSFYCIISMRCFGDEKERHIMFFDHILQTLEINAIDA